MEKNDELRNFRNHYGSGRVIMRFFFFFLVLIFAYGRCGLRAPVRAGNASPTPAWSLPARLYEVELPEHMISGVVAVMPVASSTVSVLGKFVN